MTRSMKTITIVAVASLLLLTRPEIMGGLFAFVFLGMIPGTQYSLPTWLMFVVYILGIMFVIRWLVRQPLYIGSLSRQEKTARAIARKKITSRKKAPTDTTRARTKRTRARRPASA